MNEKEMSQEEQILFDFWSLAKKWLSKRPSSRYYPAELLEDVANFLLKHPCCYAESLTEELKHAYISRFKETDPGLFHSGCFAKGTRISRAFGEMWKFMHDFFPLPEVEKENEDYWDEVVKSVGEIVSRYDNDSFVQKVMLSSLERIEQASVERRQ